MHGDAADDFTEALMGCGAAAAWVQEALRAGEAGAPIPADPEPGVGRGRLWLKAFWHNCKVVALFDPQLPQVRAAVNLYVCKRVAACC